MRELRSLNFFPSLEITYFLLRLLLKSWTHDKHVATAIVRLGIEIHYLLLSQSRAMMLHCVVLDSFLLPTLSLFLFLTGTEKWPFLFFSSSRFLLHFLLSTNYVRTYVRTYIHTCRGDKSKFWKTEFFCSSLDLNRPTDRPTNSYFY